MKRDMDLVRQILLDFENGEKWLPCLTQAEANALMCDDDNVVPDELAKARQYHMIMLSRDGFIEASISLS